MHPKLIGILAGMGPRSTAPFVDLVITECQHQYGAKNDEDFPPMIIYSLPTPFYLDRPLNHEAMKSAICNGLQKLERIGVDFIAMPCNTAHIYYQELTACIHVPLLNMINETLSTVPHSARKIALLATRPTLEAGIYQAAIEQVGLALIANETWQTQVDRLILAIKSSHDSSTPNKMWHQLLGELEVAGVDTVLLGCTDLNVVSITPASIVVLDATQCLAQAVVKRWREAG